MGRKIYKVLYYARVSTIHEEQDELQQLVNDVDECNIALLDSFDKLDETIDSSK